MTLTKLDDALGYVRRNKQLFFRRDLPNAEECAIQIISDAVILGVQNTSVCRLGAWWIIGGDTDWLVHSQLTPQELFGSLVALPEAGPNSFRSEVLPNAFAADVYAFADGNVLLVKGGAVPPPIMEFVSERPTWRRAIAFRFA